MTIYSPTRDRSETFNAIVAEDVVNYARQYFNCPSLIGMPLENNGGSGSANSHWEKLFLPSEYMNPTVENPGLISEFTFSFLRGTGWYKTRIGAAQHYDWGFQSGCKHFQICPQTTFGYCAKTDVGKQVCGSEYTGKVG